MARRLVLHVGAMKSGTSYIQSRLFASKYELAQRGVLVPGRNWKSQVNAASDVIGRNQKQWPRMSGKVRDHDGTSVISMEYLGPVRPVVIRRVLESLDGVDVQVVLTVRDLNRSLAAMWQETVQNGRTWTYADYLAGVERWRPGFRNEAEEPPESGRTFWRQQNTVRIARTWSEAVGTDHVTVVTVPHPGAPRDLLWRRFFEVVGVSPDGLRGATMPNESIGAASTLVVRRLNELLNEAGMPFPLGTELRKGLLAKQVLAARKASEPTIGLPVAPWVQEHADHIARSLQQMGVGLIGDWAELTPVEVPGVDPATIPDAEITEAALAGLAGVLAHHIREGESQTTA